MSSSLAGLAAHSFFPEYQVDRLLSLAGQSESDQWARYLISADSEAVKLERSVAGGCCGFRCSKIQNFTLTFHWSEVAHREIYQHDLLKAVVRARPGTDVGAQALVNLLTPGCGPLASEWVPYFQVALAILESSSWRHLDDVRLTQIRAEAYETWWSLSKASPGEPQLSDNRLKPEDFEFGAQDARLKAIKAYQQLTARNPRDQAAAAHLGRLRARQDTRQRQWYCFAD